MAFLKEFLLINIMVYMIDGSKYMDEPCDRIRRPLHLLTTEEKLLYTEAYQKLRENGILGKISDTHSFHRHAGTHHGM